MAAARNRVVMVSRFRQAGDHAREQTEQAVEKAIDEGEKAANIRIERLNSQRGYNLPASVEKSKLGRHSGKIEYDEFYGRFFEYGTTYIDAFPFIRPGHRKMRAVFKKEMGDLFRGFRGVRRR